MAHFLDGSGKLLIKEYKRLNKELYEAIFTTDCMQKLCAADSRVSTRSSENKENEKISATKIFQECKKGRRTDFLHQRINLVCINDEISHDVGTFLIVYLHRLTFLLLRLSLHPYLFSLLL